MRNLTQYEVKALGFYFNLADAHTHQRQSPTQAAIVDRLPELFREAEGMKQQALNQMATDAFHRLSLQSSALDLESTLICYSSSVAMEIVANLLKMRGYSVTLIEPTFDNIADILKRHGIPLTMVSDDAMASGELISDFHSIKTDAVFLTVPNNPTGTYIDQNSFHALAAACAEQGTLLILDPCFRAFEPGFMFDQYKILLDSSARFIVLEDTGKIWPTLDLKVGLINCSREFQSDLTDIHDDIQLNVSPFILRLLAEYCSDSAADECASVRDLIARNRSFIRSQLSGSILSSSYEESRISVELLAISADIGGAQLQSHLEGNGIFVLPGNQFFWHNPRLGDKYIRVALARDPAMFEEAIRAMISALNGVR